MRLLATSLALTCCLFAQEAASVADWRFAHPSPTLVGGVRLEALLESPVVNSLLAESGKSDPNVELVTAMLKTALGGVTEIRFSVLDKGNSEMDAIVMVTGKLDEALVGALSQGKAGSRRIDANTVLLGNGPSLDEAVQRLSEPPALLRNRALLRGSSLTGHDLWAAGALPEAPMTDALNLNLRGLALGMSLTNDVAIELALEAASAVMAQDLVTKAREAEATQPQLGATLEAFVEDTTARFRVKVPAEKVAQAIREGMVAQAAGAAAPAKADSSMAPPPAPPPPPKRKTIIIEGLESGPKEIPVR